jgi:hypothetical protein
MSVKSSRTSSDFQRFQRGVGLLGFGDAKTVIFKQPGRVQAENADAALRWVRSAKLVAIQSNAVNMLLLCYCPVNDRTFLWPR